MVILPAKTRLPLLKNETYNAKFSVIKKDGEGAALAGAGFVLLNSENKYYKYRDRDRPPQG